MTSNGQIYKLETIKKYEKQNSIFKLIEEIKKEKEFTYLQYRLVDEMGLSNYLFGKYETLTKILEELTKIVYNYQKFTT